MPTISILPYVATIKVAETRRAKHVKHLSFVRALRTLVSECTMPRLSACLNSSVLALLRNTSTRVNQSNSHSLTQHHHAHFHILDHSPRDLRMYTCGVRSKPSRSCPTHGEQMPIRGLLPTRSPNLHAEGEGVGLRDRKLDVP